MYYYLIILAAIVLDQLVKHFVVTNMNLNESIAIIDGFFNLTYIRNTGAAFSIFEGQQLLLIAVPGIVMLAGLIYLGRHGKNRPKLLLFSIALIIGGGIGNLYDRIAAGYVVDFLDFGRFPIFNLADIFVCVGCALLCFFVIFIDGRKA
ncbi:MAG: signal peptidase II [Anaerovoracaceae bacterium]